MILLNDLFTFKPLAAKYEVEDDLDEHYLNLLCNTSDSKYYDFGLHFVYKYYINKFIFPINKKIECINILKANFLKNPKWYTYDILKYLVLDLEFDLLVEMFNKDELSSLLIGEYLLRNNVDFDCDLKFPFYVSLPFHFYNKTSPKFDDINLIFIFPDLIDSEYKIQYYLINYTEYYKIDNYTVKINKTMSFKSDNPYTNYLLYNNQISTIKKSTELMILLYKYKEFIVEGNIYTEIIKKYHKMEYKILVDDVKYDIYNDIIREYCLIDKHIQYLEDFEIICKEYKYNILILNREIWDIEYILKLDERFFNTFITSKRDYKYKWNGEFIDREIIDLIREYHTSKLMTKKYRENLYNRILEHKYKDIFIIYSKRGIIDQIYDEEIEYGEFLINKKSNTSFLEVKESYPETNNLPKIYPPTLKRYKLNIPNKLIIENKIESEPKRNIRLPNYIKLSSYKKIIKKHVVFQEYIDIKYKSTNYKFIKYISEDRAKEAISDLIKYDLNLLNKLISKGVKLEEYEFIELIERLKKEGDPENINLIFKTINKFNYKIDILVYEELDFIGKNKILNLLKIDNKSDFLKLLIILNNEDNLRLVIKILNIVKDNKKYLDVIEKYKKDIKFNKLIIRIYPFIGEDEYYREICEKYKFKEELDLLKRYFDKQIK